MSAQMSRNMNTRFFAEFLVVLSRRVNPCPGLDDGCDEDDSCAKMFAADGTAMMMDGRLPRNNSTLSLHSRILDLTYESGVPREKQEEDKKKKEEKKEEPPPPPPDNEHPDGEDGGQGGPRRPKMARDPASEIVDVQDLQDDSDVAKWALFRKGQQHAPGGGGHKVKKV